MYELYTHCMQSSIRRIYNNSNKNKDYYNKMHNYMGRYSKNNQICMKNMQFGI